MVSVTSASRYVTSASRYQSRSSVYILGLITGNSTELAEAITIGCRVADCVLCLFLVVIWVGLWSVFEVFSCHT